MNFLSYTAIDTIIFYLKIYKFYTFNVSTLLLYSCILTIKTKKKKERKIESDEIFLNLPLHGS